MENTVPVIKQDGSPAEALELKPEWIELEKGEQAVKDTVVAFMASIRAGTGSAKTRSEVAGGGAKPYRQKGTGRARAGSNRSPIWRGGGVIFPPKPRSFAKKVNRKVRQLALKRTLSERLAEGSVIVVEDIQISEPKTKNMVAFLDTIGAGDDALVLVNEDSANLLLSARNLPGVEVMKTSTVNPYWMLLFKKIVITRAALDALVTRIGGGQEDA